MIGREDVSMGGASALEKLSLALQGEATGRQKRATDFEEAYPTLEQHLVRKVPLKVVLEKFNAAYGYSLHPPAFRKLLEAERNRRAENGTEATCANCGQPLVWISDATQSHGADHSGAGHE